MTRSIVGRHAERVALESLLAGSLPAAVLIEGVAGSGKSVLWRWALAEGSERGFCVLASAPTRSEVTLGFAALGDLFRDVLDKVLAVLPEPQRRALAVALLVEESGEHRPNAREIGVAVLSALQQLSTSGRLMVAIDDLQWLDRASREVLEFALRRLGETPVALVFSRRLAVGEDEAWPLGLGPALPAGRCERMRLAPLTIGALSAVLRMHLGITLRRPTLLRIHETSAGNPFYALELARALQRRGDSDVLRLPATLRMLVSERLQALPVATRSALLVAAIEPEPELDLVAAATGAELEVIEVAVAAEVITIDAGRVSFTHPLLASGLYSEADDMRLKELHRRLSTLAPTVEGRARHLAAGSAAPSREAAYVVEDAARSAAARGAPAVALELAEEACRLTPGSMTGDLRRRSVLASENAWAAGDYDRGRALLESAVAAAPHGPEKAALLLRLAGNPRDVSESHRLCELALAESKGDPGMQADALALLVVLDSMTMEPARAAARAEKAVRAADLTHDRLRIAAARSALSWLQGIQGGGFDLESLRAGAELEEATVGSSPFGDLAYKYSVALLWCDELELAKRFVEPLLGRARRGGHVVAQLEMLDLLADAALRSGHWQRGLQFADESLELSRQHGLEQSEAVVRSGRAQLELLFGHLEAGRAEAGWLRESAARTSDYRGEARAEFLLAFADLSAGAFADAAEHYRRVRALNEQFGVFDPGVQPYQADAVEAFLATGDLVGAGQIVNELEQLAQRLERPRLVVYAARCGGLLEAAQGRLESAIGALEDVLAAYDTFPVPFEWGRHLLALGTLQRRARRRRDARGSLERAAAVFTELGADVWLERTRAELGRIGGRTHSVDGLTPAEERVATLVAQGKTNKEVASELVVSVRAVEANLSRIYAKLGIRSRAQLAARYRLGA